MKIFNIIHEKSNDKILVNVMCVFTSCVSHDCLCLRCKEGYKLVTQTDTVNCQSDGTWSKHNVRCEPIPCRLPTNLTHVVVTGGQLTPVGGIVTISCMPGFYLEGAVLSECEVWLDFCI